MSLETPANDESFGTSLRITGDALWRRMERAVERVWERLQRSTQALEQAQIPHAVVGGNAVRIWVSQVDEAAVRNTRDVAILLRRGDFAQARQALEQAGFVYRHSASLTMFLDDANSPARDSVHILFAGEMVTPDDPEPNPDLEPTELADNFRTLTLENLVRMKLNSFRGKDRLHLADMLDVGLIDQTWVKRFPAALGSRLERVIQNPED